MKLVLRPGRKPDTAASSFAGETWRYLVADGVLSGGDTPLQRHTIGMLYRYVEHATLGNGWHGSLSLYKGAHALRLFPDLTDPLGEMTREQMAKRIEDCLIEDGFTIVDDPARPA
jgi:hypothetical protein